MATEVASVTKPPAPAAEEKKKKVFFEKPEKPDEDVFKKNLAVAEKEHEEVKAKLVGWNCSCPVHLLPFFLILLHGSYGLVKNLLGG